MLSSWIWYETRTNGLTLYKYFLGSRILSTLGFQQFLDSDEDSGEFVDEGKELIKREKRRRDRLRGRQV